MHGHRENAPEGDKYTLYTDSVAYIFWYRY